MPWWSDFNRLITMWPWPVPWGKIYRHLKLAKTSMVYWPRQHASSGPCARSFHRGWRHIQGISICSLRILYKDMTRFEHAEGIISQASRDRLAESLLSSWDSSICCQLWVTQINGTNAKDFSVIFQVRQISRGGPPGPVLESTVLDFNLVLNHTRAASSFA